MEREQTNTKSFLEENGIDLTYLASIGKLAPVFGREKEIKKLEQILCKKNKNNPLIIGEPGVGKTAIVEGLAIKMNEMSVCKQLLDKRLIQLDLTTLVAGTTFRGQMEERIKSIIQEIKEKKNIILFIDEVHTILSAGSTQDGLNTGNSFKPALSRGEITLIGATTIKEYKKTIEKDGALNRRFDKVMVEEPSDEQTLDIVKKAAINYEKYHGVKYTDKALEYSVTLSKRYITDKNFPDKALDVIDKAASNVDIPQDIKKIQARLSNIINQKENAVKEQRYLDANKLYKEQVDVKKLLVNKFKTNNTKRIITEDDVCLIISDITGIPLEDVSMTETDKISNLDKILSKQIIGQKDAIDKITKTIQRSRVGLRDINKPIGSFLFLGGSGVGKTELTKVLSKELYDNDKCYIKMDMSEYIEKINVSRLIGSAPGYVGYEDGGLLTEKVKRHPYSCVVFDEIEKADKEVVNLLLQILDEGVLTDSFGERIDFRNTIIILTSNIGTQKVNNHMSIGFNDNKIETNNKADKDLYLKEIRNELSTELLNRLDEIVVFNALTKNNIKDIIKIELDKLRERLSMIGYGLRMSPKNINVIIDNEFNEEYGARDIKRYIRTNIEDVISKFIIVNKPEKNTIFNLSYNVKEKTFYVNDRKKMKQQNDDKN